MSFSDEYKHPIMGGWILPLSWFPSKKVERYSINNRKDRLGEEKPNLKVSPVTIEWKRVLA